jgi:hypothetical protein
MKDQRTLCSMNCDDVTLVVILDADVQVCDKQVGEDAASIPSTYC